MLILDRFYKLRKSNPKGVKLVLRFLSVLIAISAVSVAWAQEESESAKPQPQKPKVQKLSESYTEPDPIPTPTIGLGLGVLTYYGDISANYRTNNPITSRAALNLAVTQPINPFLSAEFNVWYGTVAANERLIDKNRNFSSTLTGGGLSVLYNFDHILKPDRVVEPYIGVGIEYMDFRSRTDLIDEYGNNYFYWSDGTIRNMDESAPNAEELSVRLQRDYEYETDIRSVYENELGTYNEFTLAVPVSAGVNMIMTPKWNFRLGATYHFTFTDYLDGVTPASTGARKGDDAYDNLLYVGFNLGYNISRHEKEEALPEDDTPFLFAANGDEDGDGVLDFDDLCAGTPEDAAVDAYGCPLDDDGDAVGNYKDEEPNSAPGAIVDTVGVTYTDERIEQMFLAYIDSTGKYSKIEAESYTIDLINERTNRKRDTRKTYYAVKMGAYNDGIPSEIVNNMLNYSNVQTLKQEENIILIVGKYNNIADANAQRDAMSSDGLSTESVVSVNPDGSIKSVDSRPKFISGEGVAHYDEYAAENSNQPVVYRVQLGAFKKKANEKVFRNWDNIMAVSSADGFTRYYSAPFNSYSKAAAAKVRAIEDGFAGAFVVAIKGGSKVDIRSVAQGGTKGISKLPSDVSLTDEQKQYLKFKVQLGSYKKKVSTNVMESYMQFSDLQQIVANGVTHYVVGNFSNYAEADTYKKELRTKGFSDCFVVGEYQGEIVPARKAIELVK